MKKPRISGGTKVADIEAGDEFRIGETWYRALLPALMRQFRYMHGRRCLNLTNLQDENVNANTEVDEIR